MSSATEKVLLKSSDGQFFEVDKAVAQLSQTLKHLVEDTEPNTAIPLANVTSVVLAKVIEYCKKHSEASADAKDALKAWDREFVKVEQSLLFDILMASNFLNIPELLDLICQTVADMIKGKSPEEIRTIFNIKNDFTEEEEQAIRKENQWAFE